MVFQKVVTFLSSFSVFLSSFFKNLTNIAVPPVNTEFIFQNLTKKLDNFVKFWFVTVNNGQFEWFLRNEKMVSKTGLIRKIRH